MNDRLIEYFKQGIDHGYSIDHIKRVLVEKGYDHVDVSLVANYVRQEQQPSVSPESQRQPRQKTSTTSPVLIIAGILAVLSIAAGLFFAFSDSPTGAAIANPEERVDQLSEISKMDREIDASQLRVEKLSEQLREKELTIEEKNEIIDQQIKEIDNIQSQIEEQRRTIRDFLLQLLNDMLDESPKE